MLIGHNKSAMAGRKASELITHRLKVAGNVRGRDAADDFHPLKVNGGRFHLIYEQVAEYGCVPCWV